MAKNTEKGQIQTSAIASTYLQDSETLDQKADGLSPLLPAPSPVDQVCNCQPWLQLWKHRQGLDTRLRLNAKQPFSAVTLDICTLLCWPCIAERQGSGFHWKRNPVTELTVILLNLLCEGENQTAKPSKCFLKVCRSTSMCVKTKTTGASWRTATVTSLHRLQHPLQSATSPHAHPGQVLSLLPKHSVTVHDVTLHNARTTMPENRAL